LLFNLSTKPKKPKPKPRIRQKETIHTKIYYSLGSPAFLSRLSVYFLFLSEMLNLLTAVVFLFNLFYLRYLLSSRFGSFIPPPSLLLHSWNSILAFCLEPVSPLSFSAHFNVKQLTWLGLKFSERVSVWVWFLWPIIKVDNLDTDTDEGKDADAVTNFALNCYIFLLVCAKTPKSRFSSA